MLHRSLQRPTAERQCLASDEYWEQLDAAVESANDSRNSHGGHAPPLNHDILHRDSGMPWIQGVTTDRNATSTPELPSNDDDDDVHYMGSSRASASVRRASISDIPSVQEDLEQWAAQGNREAATDGGISSPPRLTVQEQREGDVEQHQRDVEQELFGRPARNYQEVWQVTNVLGNRGLLPPLSPDDRLEVMHRQQQARREEDRLQRQREAEASEERLMALRAELRESIFGPFDEDEEGVDTSASNPPPAANAAGNAVPAGIDDDDEDDDDDDDDQVDPAFYRTMQRRADSPVMAAAYGNLAARAEARENGTAAPPRVSLAAVLAGSDGVGTGSGPASNGRSNSGTSGRRREQLGRFTTMVSGNRAFRRHREFEALVEFMRDGDLGFSNLAFGKKRKWFEENTSLLFDRSQSGVLSNFEPVAAATLARNFGEAMEFAR